MARTYIHHCYKGHKVKVHAVGLSVSERAPQRPLFGFSGGFKTSKFVKFFLQCFTISPPSIPRTAEEAAAAALPALEPFHHAMRH